MLSGEGELEAKGERIFAEALLPLAWMRKNNHP